MTLISVFVKLNKLGGTKAIQAEGMPLIAFNSMEDLVLLTNQGQIYIVDIVQKKLKEEAMMSEEAGSSNKGAMAYFYKSDGQSTDWKNKKIVLAKFDCTENTLVFMTRAGRFYLIDNLLSG